MIRNIIFDMGNVLLSYDAMRACRRHLSDEGDARAVCDAVFRSPEWAMMDAGTLMEDGLARIAKKRLATDQQREAVDALMQSWHADSLAPYPGVNELLDDLHARGYKLFVLSNAAASMADHLELLPRRELLSGVVISGVERLIKPDPAIFRLICERYALDPRECLFIDDNEQNVAGASSVGMKAIWHADGNVERLGKAIGDALAQK